MSIPLHLCLPSSLLFSSVWRVLCCAVLCCGAVLLCFAVCGCVVCVCVWLCVCVRVCVCWDGGGGVRTRLRLYVQNALRVYIQNVPVCTSTTPTKKNMWAWCRYARERFECTHGFFSVSYHTPQHHTHTHTTRHHHDHHHKGHSTKHNTAPPHPHITHINLMPPKTVELSLRLNVPQHGKTHQVQTQQGLTDCSLFLDSTGGAAWPFSVDRVSSMVVKMSGQFR